MKILLIWDGDYPWDIRVDKISTSLIEQGHNVHIACRNLARKPRVDEYRGAKLFRLPALPLFFGKLNDVVSFPAFFSPLWLWHIYKTAKQNDVELIVVRDLPLALSAIWISRRLGTRCVMDMAECYPELLRAVWKFGNFQFRNIFLRNPKLADAVEKAVIHRLDQVWVMIEESAERLIHKGVPESRIHIISNTPVVERFVEIQADERQDDIYQLIYVGLLNPSRGLDTAIDAAAIYHQENKKFRFIIVGSGLAEKELRAQAELLNAGQCIEFLGWMDNTRVPELISQSDVGIVPHHRCSHWDNTIPNKLFDYMVSGKPLIVSDVPPMKRIVEETECGLSYTDYRVEELVEKLRRLGNPDYRKNLGKNGREAVLAKYNWNREEKLLAEAIKELQVCRS